VEGGEAFGTCARPVPGPLNPLNEKQREQRSKRPHRVTDKRGNRVRDGKRKVPKLVQKKRGPSYSGYSNGQRVEQHRMKGGVGPYGLVVACIDRHSIPSPSSVPCASGLEERSIGITNKLCRSGYR